MRFEMYVLHTGVQLMPVLYGNNKDKKLIVA